MNWALVNEHFSKYDMKFVVMQCDHLVQNIQQLFLPTLRKHNFALIVYRHLYAPFLFIYVQDHIFLLKKCRDLG